MNKRPIYFGYAGTIPFILLMFLSLGIDDAKDARIFTFLQLSYGSIIASFLAGIHWGQAIPRDDYKQLDFSMIPPIAAFGLMIWTFLIDPVLPLIAMAGMFWIIYKADEKLMPTDFIPEGYFTYRKRLTWIVSTTLIISALITMTK